MSDKTTITFPCDYPIKIIAQGSEDLDTRIITIINKYQDKPFEGELLHKTSKGGNYLSYTVTLHVSSDEQLKTLLTALKAEKNVLMLL